MGVQVGQRQKRWGEQEQETGTDKGDGGERGEEESSDFSSKLCHPSEQPPWFPKWLVISGKPTPLSRSSPPSPPSPLPAVGPESVAIEPPVADGKRESCSRGQRAQQTATQRSGTQAGPPATPGPAVRKPGEAGRSRRAELSCLRPPPWLRET